MSDEAREGVAPSDTEEETMSLERPHGYGGWHIFINAVSAIWDSYREYGPFVEIGSHDAAMMLALLEIVKINGDRSVGRNYDRATMFIELARDIAKARR